MIEPAIVAAILLSLVTLLTVGLALKRRTLSPVVPFPLALFCLLSLAWVVSGLVMRQARFPDPVARRVALYGTCLLSLAFLDLSLAVLWRRRRAWIGWAAGGVWLVGTLVVDAVARRAPPGANAWQLANVASALLIAGALVPTALAAFLALLARRRIAGRTALYWALASILVAAGAGLVLAGYSGAGMGVHAAAALYAVTILTARAQRRTGARTSGSGRARARAALSYGLAIALLGSAYAGIAIATGRVGGVAPGWVVLVCGAVAVVCLTLVFRPFLGLIQRLLRRMSGVHYDAERVVRDYGARIEGMLDLVALSETLADAIAESLDVERSALFLVHLPDEEEGGGYRLEAVGAAAPGDLLHGALAGDSPLARYLQMEARPLIRDVLDASPLLSGVPPEERAWLLDVGHAYVAIRTRGEWVGLLTVGESASTGAYRGEDLDLLVRLADRTTLPLCNARALREAQRTNAELRRDSMEEEQRREALVRALEALRAEHHALAEEGAVRDGFLAALAERLRLPFANLDFALQLMERYGLDGWTVDQRDQLVELKQEVGRAKQMADNVAAFAALLGEDGGLEIGELDATALIADALRPLRAQAEERGLRLDVQLPTELPPALGDQARLSDALYQLVHNAVTFAPAGSTVCVRCWADARVLHLDVIDNGVGMRAVDLDALWTDLMPGDATAHTGSSGLGLGLPLTRRIVRVHGGEVYARSDPGAGSTFGFQIPLRDAPDEGSP